MSELLDSNGRLSGHGPAKNKRWIHYLLLLFVTVLSYGLAINKLGFRWDDWGIFYARYFYGASGLKEYIASDRPFNGFTYNMFATLLGYSNIKWHIFGILVWWANGLAFYHFVRKLNPPAEYIANCASLLFIVFPTFALMYDGVIYPLGFLSLLWLILSFVMMENYLTAKSNKYIYLFLSLLFCLLEILQTENWVGLELTRIIFILLILSRQMGAKKLLNKAAIIASIKKYIPFLVVIAGFIFWRMFIFKSTRPETDQNLIMHKILTHPVQEISVRALFLASDIMIANFFSWVQCFGKYLYETTDKKVVELWAVIVLTAGAIIWAFNRIKGENETPESELSAKRKLAVTFIIIGLIVMVIGQLPLVFANNHIRQDDEHSRFGLPAILGSNIAIASFLYLITYKRKQMAVITAILVAFGAAYQCRLCFNAAKEESYYKALYYQMSWRIPQVEKNTAFFIDFDKNRNLMAINYANGIMIDGMYGVNKEDRKNQYYWMLLDNLSPRPWPAFARGIPIDEYHFDFFNFHGNTSRTISLMQPDAGCLRVVDSSNRDIMDLSPYTSIASTISNTSLIKNDSTRVNYAWLQEMFGKQTTKCWCYYFEKAELARQFGEWPKVYSLLQEALDKKLGPENDVEWVVYIEACLHAHQYAAAEMPLHKMVSKFSKSYAYNVLSKWLPSASAEDKPEIEKLMSISLEKAKGDSHNR